MAMVDDQKACANMNQIHGWLNVMSGSPWDWCIDLLWRAVNPTMGRCGACKLFSIDFARIPSHRQHEQGEASDNLISQQGATNQINGRRRHIGDSTALVHRSID